MSYDPASYDLAEHFLQHEPCRNDPKLYKMHADNLAQHIQKAVEDWFVTPDDAPIEITVNGLPFGVVTAFVSYADIALLAGQPNAKELTVTYWVRAGRDRQRSGSLAPGQSIDLEHGMHFTAVHTGNA